MPLPKSFGMNIGTASNPNDDEMMPFANVFKMSDAPEQEDWGTGTHLAPEPGQLDANGYYKYIVAGKDYVSYIVARTRQLAAMLLHSTVWVIKWDGTGTATMLGCVGSPSSGSGRLEFTPTGTDPLVLLITGLPASPGGSTHMRNIRILPLAEENSTAIASTPLKQKLAPFAGGVLRPMLLCRVTGGAGRSFTFAAGSPTVITCTAHGVSNGQTVRFTGTGNDLSNGPLVATVINANSFSVPVDTTGSVILDRGTLFPPTLALPWDPLADTEWPEESDALWSDPIRGVPIGVLAKLALECNMILWLNLPHNAVGTTSDTVDFDSTFLNDCVKPQIDAALASAPENLKKCIFEMGNETCFNQIFQSWQDCRDRGRLQFNTGDPFRNAARFHVTRAAQVARHIRNNWTNPDGVQWLHVLGAMFEENQINAELRTAVLDGDDCISFFDAYATAPYAFGRYGLSRTTPGNGELDDDYGKTIKENIGSIGQAATVTAIYAKAAADLPAFASKAVSVKAAWAGTGLQTWAYEAGIHLLFGVSVPPNTYNFLADSAFHDCIEAFLHDSRMFNLLQNVTHAWYDVCDGPGCHFNLAGQRTSPECSGMFGSMKYVSSPTDEAGSTQYRALVDLLSPAGGNLRRRRVKAAMVIGKVKKILGGES